MTTPEKKAAELSARGYRRVSTKYRIIARIDRADWKEQLAAHLGRAVAELYIMHTGDGGVPVFGTEVSGHLCDYYRRTLSRDTVEDVAVGVFRLIPSSDHDTIGYVE